MKRLTLMTVAVILLSSAVASAGAKIEVGKDKSLLVGLLLQPRLDLIQDGAYNKDTVSIDPYIRRARIMVYGQYTKYVSFFVETDSPNFGKGGDWTTKMFIQDAWMEFNIHEALQVDVGMLLLPFSHHGMQGAVSVHTLDYHSALIKYPAGSSHVWRDAGVMARGLFLDKKLEYRLAITNGVDSANRDGDNSLGILNRFDYPLITGRLTFNFFESESGAGVGGFFWDGLYLKREPNRLISPKRILSVGASGMFQQAAVYNDAAPVEDKGVSNYFAVATDVFVDWPIGDGSQAVGGQIDYYFYDYGESSPLSGMGLFGEIGYRYHCIEPVIAVEWFNYSHTNANDYMAIKGGINWWMLGHNANVKFELGAIQKKTGIEGADEPFALQGAIQTQLLF